ncbi:amino acid--[acyl-carrier-protein] ligase [Rhodococcoides corynebacterioides]|uniref:amino acid--[acyl-carrier-protein] ligase n=1 Tax=Rhodococcoides corynebacterioides TaxID=53972 RepID=UPI003F80BB7C
MTSTLDRETALSDLDLARADFRDQLVDAGLLVRSSLDGLYGRSGVFEDVIDVIDTAVRAAGREAHGTSAQRFRFPPVFPRESFEKTDYIASFPNLTGAITTFSGDNRAHADLLAARSAGEDWDHFLDSAGTMLVSAACHPVYSMLTGDLPAGGTTLDVYGYCFRHEPAVDPARMQAFRMHEFVQVGTPDQAVEHRESWIERGQAVLEQLGLDASPVIANDPFFGRAGRMLAANQRNENLKTELVVRLYGDLDEGTAVVSCNCHREHFGHTFDIRTADGEEAHSACVGFGMERIALAMFRTHGLDVTRWPEALRPA